MEMGLTLLCTSSHAFEILVGCFLISCLSYKQTSDTCLKVYITLGIAFNKKPDYAFLKVFGSACFLHLRPYQAHKFQFHSTNCVFLSYSKAHKGYKCLSSSGKIYVSRHVVFNENKFPFKNGFLTTSIAKQQSYNIVVSCLSFPIQDSQTHKVPSQISSLPQQLCSDEILPQVSSPITESRPFE